MWSRHSRRIEPMSLSTYAFCQGERNAIGRSRIPMTRRRCTKTGPYEVSRSRMRYRGAWSHGKASVIWREIHSAVGFPVTPNPTAEWISRQITEAFPWESLGDLARDPLRSRVWRDGKPDCGVDLAPDHRGFPMGPCAAIPHPGSGHLVWASFRAASARHGYSRSTDCVPITLAKRLR